MGGSREAVWSLPKVANLLGFNTRSSKQRVTKKKTKNKPSQPTAAAHL